MNSTLPSPELCCPTKDTLHEKRAMVDDLQKGLDRKGKLCFGKAKKMIIMKLIMVIVLKDNANYNLDFWQKCPFSSDKKWHFERPNLRTESKNPAKHPPK